MGKQTGFLKAVAGQTSYTLAVHALGAIIAWLVSFGAVEFFAPRWDALQHYKWLVVGTLTAIILVLAIKIYLKKARSIPVFPKLDFEFMILKKEISIRFHSLEDICYRKKITLKALRDGLGHYTDRYNWTGMGKVTARSQYDEHRLNLINRSAVWQWYETHFDRVLNKGDTIDIETVWDIEDRDKTATPFISTTVEEPTKALTMRVFFSDLFGVKQVTCEEKATMGTRRPFESGTLPLISGEAVWPIPSPKLLHYYEVRWTPHYKEN